MSAQDKSTFEKHITTVLVSVITAIVVGIGVTTLQNTQTTARIETKLDLMVQSWNEYKIGQKELYDNLNSETKRLSNRVQLLENILITGKK